MVKKAEMVTVAAARRRERKLQRELGTANTVIASRDATINLRGQQIRELIEQKESRGHQLACLAHVLAAEAADLKLVADVLRAHGAEDAEAKLRTMAGAHEGHQRRISALLGGAGPMAMAARRAPTDEAANDEKPF